MIDEFILHGSPEALHRSIIITVAFPAHGSFHIKLLKESCVVLRTVLASPVRVMDKAGLRLFSFYRHQKGCDDEVFGDSRPQGIAYNLTVEEILMGSTVKPSFVGRDLGDIPHPDPVR